MVPLLSEESQNQSFLINISKEEMTAINDRQRHTDLKPSVRVVVRSFHSVVHVCSEPGAAGFRN